ncbi:probable sucrose-phosphate synthase [Beta vulgaris subsp. vulgaris]|uniref:Probable sucrose-phosphate synthase n=1 Tax=Beta vulgaris TaxID=161934 RepID=SPSA_BETVU|nr:probable sucrose-phosphate synthase [Beta vulgaris subsp. vulgaris]P49031.1 RecName: Full=Probable sucrose-phosphate synthase; AltName: Full=UDP-glucose-fructose-phosphate glucosyltransferase [Beta vulgaris]CAA57500.1 sucrose-phosphate synthase [Beta vulgaris subsp. vulgaris]
MAGNDWINSYLEAILDVGPGLDDAKSSLLLRERGRFSPTRYFVEEVITGFDETDLHRSWVRAQATRSPQERNTRLENMCWRIWNLARQKKQLENEEAQRKTKRRMELERGRREATADMSEDLSEGEKDISAHGDSTRPRLPRINSLDAMETWISQQKEKKLYLVLISLHGLIRGENMELGRDSDTGGQVKYVVELARALGSMPGVYRVDLLTRQVSSPDVDWSYGEPTEMLNPRDSNGFDDDDDEMGESSGAYIVRIPFGPRDKYIAKEELWPYIPEFVDGALNHIVQMSKVLGEQIGSGETVWPVAIHGHYADAGDSAALLSGGLNVPMLLTGHSLGRDKLEQLLKQGRMSKDDINNTYKIMRRIEAEELSLDASEIVITSTRQEIEEQWHLYDGFDPVLERKLRARMKRGVSCYGRFMPRMVVIPPGMEFNHIVPHEGDMDGETEETEEHPTSPDPPIWAEIMRFFSKPRKPMILALARPDPKKNITTLVKAFGECRPLRELANLTLIMGNRDGIDEMSSTSSSVLLSVLKLIDQYDLYGQVAYPKHHKQADVPEIYRLAAKTKGVFINPAFIEPFGLTLIEAAAHGLPMVATKNGGPVDIQRVLDNGLLVDPHEQQSIATALLKLVADKQLWTKCQQNGLKNIHLYSWPEHSKTYLSRIASSRQRQPQWQRSSDEGLDNQEPESPSDSLRDIKDISLNLEVLVRPEKRVKTLKILGLMTKANSRMLLCSWSNGVHKMLRKARFSDKVDQASSKYPAFRRRKLIYVIAVDGDYEDGLFDIVRRIFDAAGKEKIEGSIGFILSTSYSMPEIQNYLLSKGFNLHDFDAYICNSGSELYYSSLNSEESNIIADSDYHSHIEYRWGGEGLRRTLLRWAASITEKNGENEEQVITEDEEVSTGYCFAFKIKNQNKVPPTKELRKSMRIQALRCHVIYCQNGSKMNVIPVLASRSQALRYLYVRWGVELSKMVVFVGECGDTDYEGLLGGVHKTVILKGVSNTALRSLHANRSYPLSHVVSLDSPNIGEVSKGCSSSEIQSIVTKLSKA